ncbi:MAG: B12-binding domain-containing radical SAM protein [Proteobacteria bacterium]|nr:B12-binding domain-containing radical SAM protein [Pseudomonadota bacterium]MBU1593915.1 B12-binding domain-containing radical SAM protein [Pseudomonadota bacterium]
MKKLRILLVQPSYKDCVQTLFSIYNTEEGIGFKPPLGLLSIATTIRSRTPHDVVILDCQLDDVHVGNIHEHLSDEYDVVGISAWTDFWYQAAATAARVKELLPRSCVVLGGPHISCYPAESLDHPAVDAIIMGDGEMPMLRLLEVLAGHGASGAGLPAHGLYFDSEPRRSFVPYIHKSLDELPIPDRTLLPLNRYTSVIGVEKFSTTMVTSRGCPFACVYCKMEHQPFNMRSAGSVLDEFRQIKALGISEVEIYDDTFNFSHERTLAICKGLQELDLGIKWAMRDRVDRVDPHVLQALKKAGCVRIHLGIESGSDAVLKAIGKKINVEQARKAVAKAKAAGFEVLTYYMFGLPGESLAEAQKTIELSLELDSDYAEFSITIPYPGTKAYAGALEQGVISSDYWLAFAKTPTPQFVIPQVIENMMDRKTLLSLRDQAIRRFYFRPSYMLRELLKVKSWHEFKKKFQMALGLANVLRGIFIR